MQTEVPTYEHLVSGIFPGKDFWENQLEMPVDRLIKEYTHKAIRNKWLNSLSVRQIHMLFSLAHLSPKEGLSIQQKRTALSDNPEVLVNYFLVNHFNHTRLESVITEVAQPVIDAYTMDQAWVKENKYDKKFLLFALFSLDPQHFKRVYHLDKVQKNGCSAFGLLKPPRQRKISFVEWVTEKKVIALLQEQDHAQDTLTASHFQGFLEHNEGIFLFIRRASSDEEMLLSGNRIVHGHKPDWIILDFSTHAKKVNLCAKNPHVALSIANRLVSSYFNQPCIFERIQKYSFVAQVKAFLKACIDEADPKAKLFEIKFKSTRLKNNTQLVLSIHPNDTIADELQNLGQAVGDILENTHGIKSLRIVFHKKKVTLFFQAHRDRSDQLMVFYSEWVLDKKERNDFTTWIGGAYGINVLPKAKYCC